MLNLRLGLFCLAGVCLVGQAGATTIETTSFGSWEGDLIGSPIEANFNQLAYTGYSTSAGVTLAGVSDPSTQFTFTGPDNGGYALNGQRYNGILSLVGGSDIGARINVAFSGTGQNAFLVLVGSTSGTGLNIYFSDGEDFSLTSGIYGFTLSHGITSLFITTTAGSQPVIDDFYYGVSALTQDGSGGNGSPVVSEGATLMLVLGGMLTLLGAKRDLISAVFAK